MGVEDDEVGEDVAEADREAILRRRRKLLAVALAGAALGATACTPTPCLDVPAMVDAGPEDAGEDPDGG